MIAMLPVDGSFHDWFGAASLAHLLKPGKLRGVARPSEGLGHLVIPTDSWFLDVTFVDQHLLAVEGHMIDVLDALLLMSFLHGLRLLS
jgi:hypothetical protein